MKQYAMNEVIQITGLNERQIRYYADHGVIKLSGDQFPGRGRGRAYSTLNVICYLVIKKMHLICPYIGFIKNVIFEIEDTIAEHIDSDGKFTKDHLKFRLCNVTGHEGFTTAIIPGNDSKINIDTKLHPYAITFDVGEMVSDAGL